jgi:hypothetical protein
MCEMVIFWRGGRKRMRRGVASATCLQPHSSPSPTAETQGANRFAEGSNSRSLSMSTSPDRTNSGPGSPVLPPGDG